MKRQTCYFKTLPEEIILDPEDREKLICEGWEYWWRDNGCGDRYIHCIRYRGPVRESVPLHRYLMNETKHLFVDHINHNTRDNRRLNLRLATPAQNAANKRKVKFIQQREVSSKYLGVTWAKAVSKWQACCQGHYLGRFALESDAALAYDSAAKKFFGEFASLNFPDFVGVYPDAVKRAPRASPYRNVYKDGDSWFGRAMCLGKIYSSKYFKTPEEAHVAIQRILLDKYREKHEKKLKEPKV